MKRITSLPILFFFIFGCSVPNDNNAANDAVNALQVQLDSMKVVMAQQAAKPKTPLATFLTFQDQNAEEAMNFYISLFENSEVVDVQRHPAGGPAPEGSIFVARFRLNGMEMMCSDSYVKHAWDFTPGVSIFVECKSTEEQEKLFAQLSDSGQVMMPLGNYGFSQRFGFLEDKYGVSWQLNLQ